MEPTAAQRPPALAPSAQHTMLAHPAEAAACARISWVDTHGSVVRMLSTTRAGPTDSLGVTLRRQ